MHTLDGLKPGDAKNKPCCEAEDRSTAGLVLPTKGQNPKHVGSEPVMYRQADTEANELLAEGKRASDQMQTPVMNPLNTRATPFVPIDQELLRSAAENTCKKLRGTNHSTM